LSVDAAIARAIALVLADKHGEAAALVDEALALAPQGNAGWILPIEPLLHVSAHAGIWAAALARLRSRAA
jgi:hypothetical protein